MNSNSVLASMFVTERQKFLEYLASYTIIDIGTIESVTDGRAFVYGNQIIGNKRVEYADVEVIYPGNNNGVHQTICSGSPCLIFIPASCIPNVRKNNLRMGRPAYSKDGIKVMPIGNGTDCKIKTVIDSMGNYEVQTGTYTLLHTPDCISLQQGTVLNITKNQDGSVYVKYANETFRYVLNVKADGVSKLYECQSNIRWEDAIHNDGSRTFTQIKVSGESEETQCAVSIAADGSITITSKNDISVSTEGDANISVSGSTNINSSGTISFNDNYLTIEGK